MFRQLVSLLLPISVATILVACEQTPPVAPPLTSFKVEFALADSSAPPDFIQWTYAGVTEAGPASGGQDIYRIPISVTKDVGRDTVLVQLKTLGVTTFRLRYLGGKELEDPVYLGGWRDSIANRLFRTLDTLHAADSVHAPWSRARLAELYADRLYQGNARFRGFPANCPGGIDTATIDSMVLALGVASGDSAGRFAVSWGLGRNSASVQAAYRRWLGTGRIRQGQYDTLYPFDDLPPRQIRALAFTGASDTTAIVRGSAGVQVLGRFADDSGITAQEIQILSNATSGDATSKFVVRATAFPAEPQRSWDLSGHLSIRTDSATNGLYTLKVVLKDRKNQLWVASMIFSVYQPGGFSIDSEPPTITPIVPSRRIDTVVDTMTSLRVRIGVSDNQAVKTVLLDGHPAELAEGAVQKVVSLTEGATTLVVVDAIDSSDNPSHDTLRIFRLRAVPPAATWVAPSSGSDSVPDTCATYQVRWKVVGQDVDTVLIDGTRYLVDAQKIVTAAVPLTLGGATISRIRVVDRLLHVKTDSVRIARGASIAPLVARQGSAAGVVVVPDTQSHFSASWTIQDNNLAKIRVNGSDASLQNGTVAATVFLRAGDTTRLSAWAQDALQSIGSDTIRVWRPDPRTPYLADIQKVQRGDSIVPLTDFVLPNLRFGRFEVTADLYAKVMKTAAPTAPGLPATNVNIYDAMLFCNAMSKAAGLDTFYTYSSRDAASGYLADFATRSDTVDPAAATKVIRKGFRLPTAAEWDAVASTWSTVHPWGTSEDSAVVSQYAVWNSTTAEKVGSRQPTGPGVFDLAGNAAEWVATNWGTADALTPWIVRGDDFSAGRFSSSRVTQTGTNRSPNIGFRIVKTGAL